MRLLTWNVRGHYLYYLCEALRRTAGSDIEVLVPTVEDTTSPPSSALAADLPWPDNVSTIPQERVSEARLDLVLYQGRNTLFEEAHSSLTDHQRRLPSIYLEHDPPLQHPSEQPLAAADPRMLTVHVTAFNRLMWNERDQPSVVIQHGVTVPPVEATRDRPEAVCVMNDIDRRGTRMGADIFEHVRSHVPVALYGTGSHRLAGMGHLPYIDLMGEMPRYRCAFHPARYASLSLAVCEAMALGLPVVALGTTALPSVISDGLEGFLPQDPQGLIDRIGQLAVDPELSERMGERARARAKREFDLDRFGRQWREAFDIAREMRDSDDATSVQDVLPFAPLPNASDEDAYSTPSRVPSSR
jgi:hypothetical protein